MPFMNKPRPVIQFTKEGREIQRFSSVREAADRLMLHDVCICLCAQGKQKTTGGFCFQYVPEEQVVEKERKPTNRKKPALFGQNSNETIILKELRKRSKLKGDDRFISYRELECAPFCMNSPSSHMSRLRKKHTIKDGQRIGSRGVTYSVYRLEE